MKLFTRLLLAGLIAVALAACNQAAPEDDGGGGGGGGGDLNFTNVFFKTIEEQGDYSVIVGTADLTLSNGNVTGTLTATSGDHPAATGSITGTYSAGAMQGGKQTYTGNLQLDFTDAPDYSASGSFYTVGSNLFTEQPLVLSKGGAVVGKLILAERGN